MIVKVRKKNNSSKILKLIIIAGLFFGIVYISLLIKEEKLLSIELEKAKEDETILEAFDEYEISPDEIDYIPMCFSDLDVSARTMHAVI